jgi:hypothetical protein
VVAEFIPRRTLVRLTFESPDLEGLEVVAKRTTIEGLLTLAELSGELEALGEQVTDLAELRSRLEAVLAPFAKLLVEWNVTAEDRQPVPATLAGLLAQEPWFLSEVIAGYVRGLSQAPPPLPGSSASGGSSPEPSTTALAAASSPPASS